MVMESICISTYATICDVCITMDVYSGHVASPRRPLSEASRSHPAVAPGSTAVGQGEPHVELGNYALKVDLATAPAGSCRRTATGPRESREKLGEIGNLVFPGAKFANLGDSCLEKCRKPQRSTSRLPSITLKYSKLFKTCVFTWLGNSFFWSRLKLK